ncbi:hypothetical protein TRIP_C80012 [Candidatus Zixiibacteriota bacterium]|nr:hypothetical protein TRIP_C80012 [candidate division Zixibacteria bacterium]
MEKRPVETRYPEKGIIISDGRGIQADSMLMVRIMPPYPIREIMSMIH